MTSLGSNRGPYSVDVLKNPFRNTKINTIVGSPVFDTMTTFMDDAYSYEVGYVPAGYEHRPDLISNVFYGSPKNWWLLMLVNGITDPFEGFNVNQRILIPQL